MDNRIRIHILIQEIITEVVQNYLEFKIQPRSFEVFLTSQQHLLYHLCFNKGRCCSCSLSQPSPPQQVIRKPQFVELFNHQGNACGRIRNCCCMFKPTPNIKTTDIDITLCTAIIFNCYNGSLQPQEECALREIREARNVASHSNNQNNLTTSEFQRQWNRITNAGKILANCIGRQYFEEIEDRMLRLERRPVVPTDYTESFRKLAEEKVELNESLHNVDDRLSDIETHLEKVDNIPSRVTNFQTVFNNCSFYVGIPETFDNSASTERQRESTHHTSFEIHGDPLELSYCKTEYERNPQKSEMLNIVPYTERRSFVTEDGDDEDILHPVATDNEDILYPVATDNEDTLYPVTTECQTSDEESSNTLIPTFETVLLGDMNLDDSLLHGTNCKEFAVDPPLENSDTKYFEVYKKIEAMKQKGHDDFVDAINYVLLTYIMMVGSSSVKDIDIDLLQRIFGLVHKVETDLQNINLRHHLENLTTEYMDQIGKTFTIRDMTTTSALQNLFGYAFPDIFVEFCNGDILLNHVRPSKDDCEHSSLIVPVDPDILIDSLVQKLQYDAFSVGEYTHVLLEHEMAGEFCENILQCDIDIPVKTAVKFLDGLTHSGQDFSLFNRIEDLINVLRRCVDDARNTVVHYMVATMNESDENKRFLLYIEFFCEHKFDLMLLENKYEQSPMDIAAYLGRFEVISSILWRCSERKKEDINSKIFTMVQKGVELLTGSTIETEIIIEVDSLSLSDVGDYKKILKAIGKENEIKLTECESINADDDISSIIGKGVVSLVKDVKKGLNAFTRIPALIKTVNKASDLKED